MPYIHCYVALFIMGNLSNFIGKTVVKIEESDKLDRGVKITFNDGSILECAWNNWEGTCHITEKHTRSGRFKNKNFKL